MNLVRFSSGTSTRSIATQREGAVPTRLRPSQMPAPADFEYANLPLDLRIACFFGGVLFV
jgi:hypothetical protein